MHDSGIHIAAAARPGGDQRHANLMEFHSMAQRFSRFGQQGLTRFLEFIRLHRRAAGDLGEADTPGNAAGQVRVMTIHQSKGLEFPVVVLALPRAFNERELRQDILWHRSTGIGARFIDLRASGMVRWKTLAYRRSEADKRRSLLEEELRVLYVAVTRAREQLEVVVGIKHGQLDEAAKSIEPQKARSFWQWLQHQILGGQPHSAWDVVVHDAASTAPDRSLSGNGDQSAEVDAQRVEAALRMATAPYAGTASAPPFKLTVTDLSKGADRFALESDETAGVSLEYGEPHQWPADLAGSGLSPAARGSLLHQAISILVAANLLAGPVKEESVASALREAAPMLGLAPEQAAAVVDAASLAQQLTELSQRLELDQAQLFSELPISTVMSARELEAVGIRHPLLPAGDDRPVIVQGTLDLLIERGGELIVLDFKTDRGISAAQLVDRYHNQLMLYTELTRRLLPGRNVRWALFGVDGLGLVERGG
jgi:ATP-dependent helicase/nuclease subunit A